MDVDKDTTEPFCLICSAGGMFSIQRNRRRILCGQCANQLHLFSRKDQKTELVCTTCIGKVWHLRGEGDPLAELCDTCLADIINLRENCFEAPIEFLTTMQPVPFRTVQGTIVERSDTGYVLSVPQITNYGCFITKFVFSIGDSVEVYYLTVENGRHIFVISGEEAVSRITGGYE